MSNIPNKNFLSGTLTQDLIDSGNPINSLPPGSGLFNTPKTTTAFTYNAPAGARVIENQGAYITLGGVSHGTQADGYGAKGLPAEAIDFVVGRQSSRHGGKGPPAGSAVDNHFALDAGRIYISRLTDIDAAFGLASRPGINDSRGSIARSAIGMKADAIRIVGREGVKIVTGKMQGLRGAGPRGESNSLGGDIQYPAPPIELIAGNNYDNVQGVSLGNKTRDSLTELHQIIGEIWSALYSLALVQAGMNTALGVNIHPWIASAAPIAGQQNISRVLNSLYQTRVTATYWQFNYLTPRGSDYIVSSNVRTN